jgi:hypothetical protein
MPERPAERRPRRIAVIGMGRSGTTFLIQLLGRLGVFLDSVNWASEHEEARAINDAYLEQNFGARPGLPYGRLPSHEIVISDGIWLDRVRTFVEEMDVRCGLSASWAFKDPRTTILFDMWRDQVDVAVGVFRAPASVAESFLRQKWIRGPFARRKALHYWFRFNQSLLRIIDDSSATAYLLELAPDLPEQARALADRLGLVWSPDSLADYDANRQVVDAVGPRRERNLYEQLRERRLVPG